MYSLQQGGTRLRGDSLLLQQGGPAICVMLLHNMQRQPSPQGNSHRLTFPKGGFLIAFYVASAFRAPLITRLLSVRSANRYLFPSKPFLLIVFIIAMCRSVCQLLFSLLEFPYITYTTARTYRNTRLQHEHLKPMQQ